MRTARTLLAALSLILGGLLWAAPAHAAEGDSQRMCDNIPNDDGGGTYTEICVRINSTDYGSWRRLTGFNVSYYNPKVSSLYGPVSLYYDPFADGSYFRKDYTRVYEGFSYIIDRDCDDPCYLIFHGWASEPNDLDSEFDMRGYAEADD